MNRLRRSLPFQSLTILTLAVFASLPMHGQAAGAPAQPAAVAPATGAQPAAAFSAGQQEDETQITTIHAYSNLVVVDVVVTDSQGNPVRGLKASDFTLTENNRPQTLRNFEEHTASPASSAQIEPAPKLPAGLFTNQSPAPANGPVNVLLLDYLNTPLTSQPYARRQLLDYLNKAPAGTRIAVFALTTHLIMLQGFTSDIGVLKAALTSKRGAPQTSDIMTDEVNGGPIGSNLLSEVMANDPTAVEGMITQEMVDDVQRFEALDASFQQDMIARYTLDAFDQLARYLVGIPGRKNVIWFSGGFPLNVEPNPNEADPNDSVVRNDEEVRKTDNLLTRAQVAVYPVDARGLFVDPAQNFSANTDMTGTNGINGGSGAAAANEQMSFQMQRAQEHETMEAMAEDTGGHAFYNGNGLAQAVATAIENGSNYYTLTYSPTDQQWDSRFRAIKIKVDQPNMKLNYRNGYYAVDPNDRSKLLAGQAATALVQPTTMAAAMLHGGPEPSEILFKVRIRPASMPPEPEPLKSNQSNPDPKVKIKGPFKAYGVDLVPDPRAVSCREDASGDRHCAIEVWTFIYNAQGEKLITASNRLHSTMSPAEYARMLKGQLAFHQEISVPVKGNYFLRTAIHDMISDRVGAVEVPIAVVARLEPLQAETAPAPALSQPGDGGAGAPAAPPSAAAGTDGLPATPSPQPAAGASAPASPDTPK